MPNVLLCEAHRAAVKARDDTRISDALLGSGNVILVCGINYAAFEEIIRPVFSQMPSAFGGHSGVCFLRYGSDKFDFTLVVTGENNENSSALLRDLMPRLQRIVVLGPMTYDESDLIRGESPPLVSITIISAVAIEDCREYFVGAMKSALRAISPHSSL